MLDFAEITINEKNLFDRYLGLYHPRTSDISFTNLFMWRNYYKFRFTEMNGLLCIIAVPEGSEPFALTPAGGIVKDNFSEAVAQLKEYFKEKGWQLQFKKVEENDLKFYQEMVSSEDDIIYDRDNSDYIYLASDLINLKGKKFDGKRNHINKFKKLYAWEYVAIEPQYMDACYHIMEKWCAERNCEEHPGFYTEKLANAELLHNYDKLGCKGALIQVNGEFEGFTVGEMLNSDTAVIHIEKASSQINGLYTMINQQFCEHEWQNAMYINREQDLGVEGLRKAKLSYNPVKLMNKYMVIVK